MHSSPVEDNIVVEDGSDDGSDDDISMVSVVSLDAPEAGAPDPNDVGSREGTTFSFSHFLRLTLEERHGQG